jgi:rhamnosyltransferase
MNSQTQSSGLSVGVAIITHRAKTHLPHCLPLVLASSLAPRVLVVNSSSNDGTVELAKDMGAEVLVIPRKEFNHGLTRERARKELATEIVVFMTPDAYPISEKLLGFLVKPLVEGKASLAYARQVPRDGGGFLEAATRRFSYPETSHVRSIQDFPKYGAYTYFFSDACSAYLNSALDEVGGFPNVLVLEDTIVAAKLLRRGHRIAYVAEAIVKHSHPSRLIDEFRRYFDTGYSRRMYSEVFEAPERAERLGSRFVRALLGELYQTAPWLMPYALLCCGVRFFGFEAGRFAYRLPRGVCRLLSAQDVYWSSNRHPA